MTRKPQTCPCCGQIIPPELSLSRIQKRLYEALKARPRTADELRDIAWADDPDGGPEDWRTIYSHIYLLNLKLKEKGLIAKRPWRVIHEPYHLVPL